MKYRPYLVLLVLCMAFYANSLQNDYAVDDTLVVVNNSRIQKGIAGIPEIFSSYYSQSMQSNFGYRPITSTTFAIEYQFFGESPFVSHLINVLLYVLTCLLVFKIVMRLFGCHWTVALLTAVLFAIHPLHSEPVNNIKSRDELLSLLFALQSLFVFLKYFDQKRKQLFFYGLIFFMLSYWSKASSIPFIAIIPFLLWVTKKANYKIAIGLFFYLGTGMFILNSISGFILPGSEVRAYLLVENPLFADGIDLLDRIQFSVTTVGFYIKTLFVPSPMYAYYGFGAFPGLGETGLLFWVGLVGGMGGLFFAIKNLRKQPLISCGIFFFLLAISLFSNLLVAVVGIVADRFAYAASVGFVIMLTGIVLAIFKVKATTDLRTIGTKKGLYGLVLALTVISFFIVFNRNQDWKNDSHLLQADVKNGLKSAKVFQMLGDEFMFKYQRSKGEVEKPLFGNKAALYYRQSLEVYEENPGVLGNMGVLNFDLTNYDQSIKDIEKAIDLGATYPQNYRNLALSYELKKDYANAIRNLEMVVQTDSTDFDLYSKLIQFKVFAKDYNGALDRTIQAIQLFPHLKESYLKAGQQIAEIEHGKGTTYFLDLLRERGVIEEEEYEPLKNLSSN